MAVYVDESKWQLGRMKMCHMIADSTEELLEMASLIGVKERHIQYQGTPKEHFDICKQKRESAIKHGAIQISSRDLVKRIRFRKSSHE